MYLDRQAETEIERLRQDWTGLDLILTDALYTAFLLLREIGLGVWLSGWVFHCGYVTHSSKMGSGQSSAYLLSSLLMTKFLIQSKPGMQKIMKLYQTLIADFPAVFFGICQGLNSQLSRAIDNIKPPNPLYWTYFFFKTQIKSFALLTLSCWQDLPMDGQPLFNRFLSLWSLCVCI